MKNIRALRKEQHGAGEWGTPELTDKYKAATPGQTNCVPKEAMIKVSVNRPIGHRIASIGPGGKEYDVQTKDWPANHTADAQSAHQAAHTALKKGDIETYHKEMDKKFAAHQAASAEASKKPIKTYEAFTPDAGQLGRVLIKNKDNGSFHMDPKSKGAAGRNGIFNPARAKSFGSEEEAHAHALKHLYTSKKGYDLVRYHNGKILENESGVSEAKAFTPDAGRQTEIHKDYTDLKVRSTSDLHKTHQKTLGKIHSKYTPGDVGGKQGMIADILRHRHGDKHVAHYFGLKEDTTTIEKPVTESDDTKNLRITKHERMAVEAEKKGDTHAQQYHLNIVNKLKNESVVSEATKAEPQKHLVTVTVTDPHHPAITQRKTKIMKRVKVSAADPKQAVKKAEAHYKKHGFKVHDSFHHSVVKESLDSDEIIDSKDNSKPDSHEAQEIAMAKGQFAEIADMAQELVDAMDDADELEPWMHSKITTAYVNLDDVYSYITYGDEYSTDGDSKDEGDQKKEGIDEATTEQSDDGEENQAGLSDEEKAQIGKIKTLIRLGLIDSSQMQVTLRAIKKLDLDQPVTSSVERQAINNLVQQLIGVVTGDDTVFRKIRLNVQK